MTILSYKEYNDKKFEFLNQSEHWNCDTSFMDKDGKYVKTYVCDNGNVLTEINRPVYENVDITVKGIDMSITVKLFESEMFSNKFSSVFTEFISNSSCCS